MIGATRDLARGAFLAPDQVTETQLQDRVIELAAARGWRVHHVRPARTSQGWRTPLQGHKGFPDLTLARHGQLVVAELKSAKGRLSKEQKQWAEHLTAGGDTAVWCSSPSEPEPFRYEYHLWRPADWPQIVDRLW